MTTFLLFVYGTLKRGGCRHAPLMSQRYLGEVWTTPGYALLDLGTYPGMIHNGGQVHGEMYEVERSLIPLLDRMEGAPHMFALEVVELEGHSEVVAYFYKMDASGHRRIDTGRWENT